jgi:hypothetical protein
MTAHFVRRFSSRIIPTHFTLILLFHQQAVPSMPLVVQRHVMVEGKITSATIIALIQLIYAHRLILPQHKHGLEHEA